MFIVRIVKSLTMYGSPKYHQMDEDGIFSTAKPSLSLKTLTPSQIGLHMRASENNP